MAVEQAVEDPSDRDDILKKKQRLSAQDADAVVPEKNTGAGDFEN